MKSPNQIEIYGRWFGFYGPADIGCLILQLNKNGDWTLQDELTLENRIVPGGKITRLVNALNDPSPEPDPVRLNRKAELLEQHFGSMSTNDSPELLIELKNGVQSQYVKTNSQHTQLLPWKIGNEGLVKTYNPDVSIALADILPDDWMYTERLRKCTLKSDSEYEEQMEQAKKAFEEYENSKKEQDKPFDEMMADFDSAVNELLEKEMLGENVEYNSGKLDYTANQIRTMSLTELTSLVEQGFDLSTSDETGQTALMLASFPPFHQEQFDNLVAAGADVNARRSNHTTGLMIACAGWEEKVVPHWVKAGADVNLRGSDNCTALMLGTKRSSIVRCLLENGADPALKDSDGDTALDYAIENPDIYYAGERLESIAILSEAIGRVDLNSVKRSLERAIRSAHKERIREKVGDKLFSNIYQESKVKSNRFEVIKKHSPEMLKTIDLEINEVELADRIVKLISEIISRIETG